MVGSYVSQVGRISQGILSPVRMPIPPLRHIVKVETRQILTQYKVFPIAVLTTEAKGFILGINVCVIQNVF